MSARERFEAADVRWVHDDGGREEAGFKGTAGDCGVRAWAIATGKPYQEVYDRLFELNREFAKGRSKAAKKTRKNPSPRNGVFREVIDRYAAEVGFVWVPTMAIGQGCTVHLKREELPEVDRLVCAVSRHYVAVIEGVIRDTYDSSRDGTRCVYGYYRPEVLEDRPPRLRVVCAWCDLVLEEGDGETSHGMCDDCAAKFDDDGLGLDRLAQDAADAADTLRRIADAFRTMNEVLESVAARLEAAVEGVERGPK